MMKDPLKGVRILSLAEQYPGPLASMVLADLGADVILVERPNGGDPSRRFTGHFEALNRNKRSIVLDLKSVIGRKVFRSLIATADVLMEGFRPGVMARLGLDADALRREFPALIYTSISSFGHSGPLSPRGGHDLSMQGLAGFVSQGESPTPAAIPLADIASAMYAAIGITTALYARRSSGSGATIDVSMLDCLVAWRSTALVSSMNSLVPAPYPPDDPGYGVFRVGDAGELVTLSISGEDHQWRELCLALGLDTIAGLTTVEREQQAPALRLLLEKAFRGRKLVDIESKLAASGVGIGRVNDSKSVVADPQIRARGIIVEVENSPGLRVVKQPIQFDGSSGVVRIRAPQLGEHTREIMSELGVSDADIEAYAAAGGNVPPVIKRCEQ
ncbi:MAG: CaiB/BaiF CoA transferase family protein [Thermomicrobiales bacterium]